MRLISEQDIERLIDPSMAIATAIDAYRRHAAGDLPPPGRLDLPRQEPTGNVLVLAGHGADGLFCVKSNVHVYPDPVSRQRKAASMMMLWDAVACRPVAWLSTTGFNNHRTAAGLAAAADRLAPRDARALTVFGAGKIAPAVIRYLKTVRPLERIVIVGRGPARAAALAARLKQQGDYAYCEVRAEADATSAVRDADIVVTITTATQPVFPGDAVQRGALVILAGANRPHAREADDALMSRATIYVDHRDGCLARAGDLAIPLATGRLAPTQIAAEIGLLWSEPEPAIPPADVTVFKSIGVVAQDIALARALVDRAETRGIGTDFDPDSGAVATAEHGAPRFARSS